MKRAHSEIAKSETPETPETPVCENQDSEFDAPLRGKFNLHTHLRKGALQEVIQTFWECGIRQIVITQPYQASKDEFSLCMNFNEFGFMEESDFPSSLLIETQYSSQHVQSAIANSESIFICEKFYFSSWEANLAECLALRMELSYMRKSGIPKDVVGIIIQMFAKFRVVDTQFLVHMKTIGLVSVKLRLARFAKENCHRCGFHRKDDHPPFCELCGPFCEQ